MPLKSSDLGRTTEALVGLLGTQGVQLTRLFDVIDDVQVWVKDRQGHYLWVNRAFLAHYVINEGVPVAPLSIVQGKTDYDLCDACLADQFRADDEKVLSGSAIVNRFELVGHRDLLASWNVTSKYPLRNAHGTIVGTAGLTRQLKDQDVAPLGGDKFRVVLDHLRDNFRESMTNRQLARLAGLSTRAFERKFLDTFHTTPQRYLKRLRLRMASRALLFTRQSIVEVALGCGFADQSHFTREFHRYYRRTPREFRDENARFAAGPILNSAAPKQ